MIPAVILSAHTMALAVIRALGQAGIPLFVLTYQAVDMAQVSKYVKQIIEIPHPENDSVSFVNKLITIGKSIGRSVLIPTDDATIVTVSQHKEELEQYFTVACPEWEITEKFIVKKYTYQAAEEAGIPAPHTYFPKYAEEAKVQSRQIQYPCLVKPFQSHKYFELYRKKMTVVDNPDQLMLAVEDAFLNKLPVMLQEIIPGDETNGVNYNCYRAKGRIIQDYYAKKIRLSHSGFGVPVVVKAAKEIPAVAEYAEQLLKKIDFNGFSCTEFKFDERDNKYKLMEINGRHNRSALLAIKSGINFPLIEYNYLVNGILPEAKKYKTNIYWIDEFRDIETFYQRIFKENYKLFDYVKPYFHSHVFAISSISDPAPFFKRTKDAIQILKDKIKSHRKGKKDVIKIHHFTND